MSTHQIVMADILDENNKSLLGSTFNEGGGFLSYSNNRLQYYKYKPLSGKYSFFIYLIVVAIRSFLKDKLVHDIKKEDIESIKIESVKASDNKYLNKLQSFTGQISDIDTLIITMKDGATFTFKYSPIRENDFKFSDLVVNMGMITN